MASLNQTENGTLPTVVHFTGTYLFLHGTWVYSQIRYLESWRPIVLCGKTENLAVFPFEPIYSLQSLAKPVQLAHRLCRRLRGHYPYFKQAMQLEQAQLIHAHFGPAGYGMLPLARVAKVPLVTTFYGYDLSRLPQKSSPDWRSRYERLFAEGDMFLLEGPYMRQQLIALGCPPEKAHVQRLGIDLSRLPFAPRKASSDGCVRVLAAATFTEKKGLVYAVEAFGRLCQTYEQVRLTIIGDARNRPDMIPILQVFCFTGLMQSIGTLTGNLYLSQGRSDLQLRVGLFVHANAILGIMIGLRWGALGVAIGLTVASIINSYPSLFFAGRLVNLTYWQVWYQLLGILGCALTMATAVWGVGFLLPAVWPYWLLLAVQTLLGVIVYGALVHFLRVPAYVETQELIREQICHG